MSYIIFLLLDWNVHHAFVKFLLLEIVEDDKKKREIVAKDEILSEKMKVLQEYGQIG
jgi:hypothetical protein